MVSYLQYGAVSVRKNLHQREVIRKIVIELIVYKERRMSDRYSLPTLIDIDRGYIERKFPHDNCNKTVASGWLKSVSSICNTQWIIHDYPGRTLILCTHRFSIPLKRINTLDGSWFGYNRKHKEYIEIKTIYNLSQLSTQQG